MSYDRIALALAVSAALLLAKGDAGAADRALGEYLASECVSCHQLSGPGVGGIPSIAGMAEDSLAKALLEYKTGRRGNPVMRTIAAGLSEEEIAALAAYFAAQGK